MFKIGDQVETIDDNLKGTVVSVNKDGVSIETEDGFVFVVDSKEILVVDTSNEMKSSIIESSNFNQLLKEDQDNLSNAVANFKKKDKEKAKFIVDLHSHEITDTTKGMSPHDILNLQLDTARHKLEFAIKKHIKKMVFIHGVGEGVLKQELHTLLRRYENIDFYDAEFKTFGMGATEVRIYQN